MNLRLAQSSEELEFLYSTRCLPEVDKMLSGDPPQSYKQHIAYIDKVQGKSRWIYIAYIQNRMIGYSQVYDITEDTVEVGFVVHPREQGYGMGKLLVEETLSLAKRQYPSKQIILYVMENNPKAIHIYKNVGFVGKELKMILEDK